MLPQKRCDWTGRRQKLADCGRPHASRGAALLERGGPVYSRLRHLIVPELCVPQVRFLRAHACERLLGFLGGPKPPLEQVIKHMYIYVYEVLARTRSHYAYSHSYYTQSYRTVQAC